MTDRAYFLSHRDRATILATLNVLADLAARATPVQPHVKIGALSGHLSSVLMAAGHDEQVLALIDAALRGEGGQAARLTVMVDGQCLHMDGDTHEGDVIDPLVAEENSDSTARWSSSTMAGEGTVAQGAGVLTLEDRQHLPTGSGDAPFRVLAQRWLAEETPSLGDPWGARLFTDEDRERLFAWVRARVNEYLADCQSSVGREREFIADHTGSLLQGPFAKGNGTKGTALAWDLCEAAGCWS